MYQPILNLAALDANQRADLVRSSALFDEQWYRAQYPEIEYHQDGNPDPAYHYANYGYRECLPSVLFDGISYLQDHELSDTNPLLHCLVSGTASQNYRCNGALEQALAKKALGLELFTCERLLLAEHCLKPSHAGIDLTQRPSSLELQLYVKAALHPSKVPQSDLAEYLSARGVNPEFITKPQATYPIAELAPFTAAGASTNAAEQLNWDQLPQSLRVCLSALPLQQFIVPNRASHQAHEVVSFALEAEQKILNAQLSAPLHPDYQEPRRVLIYGADDPIVQALVAAIKHKSSLALHQLEFWCAHGQVLCLLSHQGPATTVFDAAGKLLPYAVGLDHNGPRPVNTNHEISARFEELRTAALQAAGDAEFMAVTFLVIPGANVHVISQLSTLPHGGAFTFTQGFGLKLAQKAHLTL